MNQTNQLQGKSKPHLKQNKLDKKVQDWTMEK